VSTRILLFLLLAISSCGEKNQPDHAAAEVRLPDSVGVLPPAPPPPIPAAVEGYPPRYMLACESRKMALEPKDGPAQHFSLQGFAQFRFADADRSPLTQAVEIALGGPTHMRFLLRAEGKNNVFLLEAVDQAWLKLPGNPGATSYEPEELAEDALLRWTVLQFPWSMKKELDEITDWVEFKENSKTATTWRMQCSGRGLPEKIFRKASEQDSFKLHLELDHWTAGEDSIIYPTTWIWHRQWGEMEETFESISGGALYFDSAFRPKSGEVRSYNTLREKSAPTFQRAGTHFGEFHRDMVWLDDATYAKLEPKPAAKKWWVLDDSEISTVAWVLDDGLAGLPEGVSAGGQVKDELCLLWRNFRPMNAAKAALRMRDTAKQNNYRAVGPVWILDAPTESETALREYLLPVQK
jgi:hypothetical protein